MRRWKDGFVGGRSNGSGCTGAGRTSGFRLRHRAGCQGRIEAYLIPNQPPVQIRTGGAAGGAERADDLTLRHAIAGADGDILQMDVKGRQAVAVIDDDGAAGKIEAGFGKGDGTRGGGLDRRAGGRGDVDAEMRLSRLTVEKGLAAVNAGDDSRHRQFKWRLEGNAVALLRESAIDLGRLLLDAHQR